MELLNELPDNDWSRQRYEIPTQVIEGNDNDNGEYSDQTEQQEEETLKETSFPDLGIIDTIRKRLNGEETQKVDTFEKNEENDTENERNNRLPQLDVDPSNIVPENEIPLKDNNDNGDREKISREEYIRVLAQKKKEERERLAEMVQDKANQSEDTMNDIDKSFKEEIREENVLKRRKTGISKKEIEEGEQFINTRKRALDIRPEFKNEAVFTKDKLLSAFDENSSEEGHEEKSSPQEKVKSTPATSPIKSTNEDISFSSHTKASSPGRKKKNPRRNPFELYAQKLKKEVNPSNNKERPDLIELGSEQDESLSFEESLNINKNPLKKIPELSKAEKLSIKQKYSKRRLAEKSTTLSDLPLRWRNMIDTENQKNSKPLFSHLKQANVTQLLEIKLLNPRDVELIEDMEKDDEVMESLLEKEIQRAKKIRLKEKLKQKREGQEKENLDLECKLNSENSVGEVPDSDDYQEYGDESEEANSSGIEDSEGTDSHLDNVERSEQNDDGKNAVMSTDNLKVDDSYMFGASNSNDMNVSVASEAIGCDATLPSLQPTKKHNERNTFDLTQKLEEGDKNTRNAGISDQVSHITRYSESLHGDNPKSTLSSHHGTTDPTQQDSIPTQADENATSEPFDNSQKSYQSDDDEITPNAVTRARQSIRRKKRLEEAAASPSSEDEFDRSQYEHQLKMREEKERQKEIKAKKRRRELERSGLKEILDGEAEESEDQWQGLGGMDGELSDEKANSEDERMIDNNYNLDTNDEEVRRKFMEEHKMSDQKQVEQLLDDIKNHKLLKRARGNNNDIELSDEEDEILAAYKKDKLEKQRQMHASNRNHIELMKSQKAKAFFDSIEDSTVLVNLDDNDTDSDKCLGGSDQEYDEPEGDSNINLFSESKNSEKAENIGSRKKYIKVDESFVKRKLSSLLSYNGEQDEYDAQQKLSNFQHDIESESDTADMQLLKFQSFRNLGAVEESRTNVYSTSNQSHEKGGTDSENDFMPLIKKPSIITKLKSAGFGKPEMKDGNHFSGVTVSNQYKLLSRSKGPVNYHSKQNKNGARSFKKKEIERNLNKAQLGQKISLFKKQNYDGFDE